MFYSTQYSSPIGAMTLAAQNNQLVGLWLAGQKYFADTVDSPLIEKPNLTIFKQTKQWLDDYFSGRNPAITALPLAPIGGEFRQHVWQILCEIPYGQVTSYGEIAKQVAKKMNKNSMSSQAVGGAVGRNPISIIIPCHRVVGSNGSLTGYAGGIDKKIQLLKLEGANIDKLFIPKISTAP